VAIDILTKFILGFLKTKSKTLILNLSGFIILTGLIKKKRPAI